MQLARRPGGPESAGEHQLHPVFLRRKNDRGAADEGLPVVEAERDREVRRGIVRRENVGAARHVEGEKLFELPWFDRVRQLDRRQDALDARFLGVLGKSYVFQFGL